MAKDKKGRKLAVQLKENKVTLKKRNLNARSKWVCGSFHYRKKTSAWQRAKQKSTEKLWKVPKKLAVSNMLVEHNKEIYDRQIKQLNLVLKRSSNCQTLTQDELKMLFLKYKRDGHYRPDKNLSPFTILADGTSGTTNGRQFCDATQCTSIPDVQVINYKNSNEAAGNLYCDAASENERNKENLSLYRNMQINLKHDTWKPKAVLKESNVDNKVNNKYLCVQQSPAIDSNYNRMLTTYDTQTCNNASMLNDAQNFDQPKSNFDVNRISNIADERFYYNLMNADSILSEDQSYRYMNESLLCNPPNSSLEYENVTNGSGTSQQNDMQCPMWYNDLWDQNLCNDFHSNNWNCNASSMNNSNVQSWKNQPMCTYTNNLDSYYHKNHSERQSNFNSDVNMYQSMANGVMPYVANSSESSQQDFNSSYTSTSNAASNNFFADVNAFISSYANINDQCM
ncbi:uncharacterized protein LOC143366082 [Andrena cerasifolii]|uniref:uncharacterized protein LOC143366082 n=1 Tax=Andrena cerasifolii TaxID=2819439 RepID=UPI0040383584